MPKESDFYDLFVDITIKPRTFALQIMRCVPWPKESDYCNVLQVGMDCNGLKVERGLMSSVFSP
jgi:hypothetical protein